MEAPSVPPAVAVEAVVETVLEALPAALPVAPDEQDEQDDEPPPADDYYEVDMDTLAYLDAAPEPDVVVVEEPLPAARMALPAGQSGLRRAQPRQAREQR
ncbi:hypothetical protein PAERUG_P34_London_28_VIM_2_02_12_00177 [Pseudomonas aeruginosa]|nr:hypothetical protein PAERUG_P34_London_28_VIM_2_02_12_00177 [Pseudomonas aeruginosa]